MSDCEDVRHPGKGWLAILDALRAIERTSPGVSAEGDGS